VTPEAQEFVERAVDTIQQLEILVLLRQSSDRFWRVDEIAAALQAVLNKPPRESRTFSDAFLLRRRRD
jgi:hypothetical protein